MTILLLDEDFCKGWKIFCAGGYLDACTNDAQCNGYAAAWRNAEATL